MIGVCILLQIIHTEFGVLKDFIGTDYVVPVKIRFLSPVRKNWRGSIGPQSMPSYVTPIDFFGMNNK